ncbi:exported hypothetical protein [Frankia sp. Hr75.2]|nr:exported hypothetical protein [Frankia sp. Hr75.2]
MTPKRCSALPTIPIPVRCSPPSPAAVRSPCPRPRSRRSEPPPAGRRPAAFGRDRPCCRGGRAGIGNAREGTDDACDSRHVGVGAGVPRMRSNIGPSSYLPRKYQLLALRRVEPMRRGAKVRVAACAPLPNRRSQRRHIEPTFGSLC